LVEKKEKKVRPAIRHHQPKGKERIDRTQTEGRKTLWRCVYVVIEKKEGEYFFSTKRKKKRGGGVVTADRKKSSPPAEEKEVRPWVSEKKA